MQHKLETIFGRFGWKNPKRNKFFDFVILFLVITYEGDGGLIK